MNILLDLIKLVPFVAVTNAITWGSAAYRYRVSQKEKQADKHDRLEIHRDELTFELLQSARAEMAVLRSELDDMRKETNTLRKLERHFFHFQQALDHLDALLSASSPDERENAERNARAFLNRMRRLAESEGTIANEVQRVQSEVSVKERQGITVFKGPDHVEKI